MHECREAQGCARAAQRFGSGANLNVHFHGLVLDGVYRIAGGRLVLHPVASPSHAELARVLERIVQRILALLTRRGYWVQEPALPPRDEADPSAQTIRRHR